MKNCREPKEKNLGTLLRRALSLINKGSANSWSLELPNPGRFYSFSTLIADSKAVVEGAFAFGAVDLDLAVAAMMVLALLPESEGEGSRLGGLALAAFEDNGGVVEVDVPLEGILIRHEGHVERLVVVLLLEAIVLPAFKVVVAVAGGEGGVIGELLGQAAGGKTGDKLREGCEKRELDKHAVSHNDTAINSFRSLPT